ncbi:Armadillo-type fold [Pseudocohnilembus persalinus]|uniref:Armadillo-type fold n=1 Tax=Pseudocohnilembus persalinus TaxID=266149 RepID=A0A0V0R6A0_PSEPJ|nr:Armadillo-type fold [Pseudocohnilembus persalinus]|eukprot:KRX09749.1 Armadillo-type fold [Pseudocohnilembus persalinus]
MDKICEIFQEVQESASVTSKQIYALLDVFEQDKNIFLQGVENCYLKVIKNLLKAGKSNTQKFEKLAERLFAVAYNQYNSGDAENERIRDIEDEEEEEENQEQPIKKGRKKTKGKKNKRNTVTREEMFSLFQYFLEFFNEGLESPQLQIKIFCARIIFFLLKTVKSEDLAELLDEIIARNLITNIIGLLRDKRPSIKKIGIKISSYLQYLGVRDEVKDEIEVLRHEMLKIMCTDENDDVRNDAVTNLDLNDYTFPHLVRRVRDKSLNIRQTVFRKLIKEQVLIANLPQQADIYKLIYDGLGSRDQSVRDVCVRYLTLNFKLFKEDEEKFKEKMNLEFEEGEGEQVAQGDKTLTFKDIQILFKNFLSAFEIEKTLFYPHLYQIMEEMLKELIKTSVIEPDNFSLYLRELLGTKLNMNKTKNIQVEGCELFLLRVLCQMLQDPEEKKEIHSEVQATVEDYFPNGIDFCQVIMYFSEQEDLLAFHQCLLLAEMLINTDEAGRDTLQKTLQELCINMEYFEADLPDDDVHNDVYKSYDKQQLIKQQFTSAQYETPIIMNSNDLLFIIIRIFRKLIQDNTDFSTKILQLISDVKESLEKGEDEQDLSSELQENEARVQKLQNKINQLEEEVKKLKGKKGVQQQVYKLDQEKKETYEHLKKIKEETEELEAKISQISVKSLIISQALFMNCKVSMSEPLLGNLLKYFIVPKLDSNDDFIKANAAKAIALFVLTDKKLCEGYSEIYKDMLDLYEGGDNNNSLCQHIISIKSLIDFMMLYNFNNNQEIDVLEIVNQFTRIAFQGDLPMRTLAVEGLCKLLINEKIQEYDSVIASLMLLWFDADVIKSGGFKIVQILSAFFRKYLSLSYQNVCRFEQGLEIVLLTLISMKQDMALNSEYIGIDQNKSESILKILNISKNLISYEGVGDLYEGTNQTGPSERLFNFLAKKVSQGSEIFMKLFQQLILTFDFIQNAGIEKLSVVQKFFNLAFTEIENSRQNDKDTDKFSKNLELRLQQLKDDENQPEVTESYVDQQFQKINEQLQSTASHAAEFIKNLCTFNLIVDKKNNKQVDMQTADVEEIFEQYHPSSLRKDIQEEDDENEDISDNENNQSENQTQKQDQEEDDDNENLNQEDENEENEVEEEEEEKEEKRRIRRIRRIRRRYKQCG